MMRGVFRFVLLVSLSVFAFGCSYTNVDFKGYEDGAEPQQINFIEAPVDTYGVKVTLEKAPVGQNNLRITVSTNFSGFLPGYNLDGNSLRINVNGMINLIPSAGGRISLDSYLFSGMLSMMAYHLDDRCILPTLSASVLFAGFAGVHGNDEVCPYVDVHIRTPWNKCETKESTGFSLAECPIAPTPPTGYPTRAPTFSPTTAEPTSEPTTRAPTKYTPTEEPTDSPSNFPTTSPTLFPSASPSTSPPSVSPTFNPTRSPTVFPTKSCFESSQTAPCTDRPDCFEGNFGDLLVNAINVSTQLDEASKFVAIAFLQGIDCHEVDSVPSFCMFLDAPSCIDAVNDGYCGNTNAFTLGSLQHLAGYPRPPINCFPVVDETLCESKLDQTTCEDTYDPFFGFNRQCIWLDLEPTGNLCRSPTNLNQADCSSITAASCPELAPVCEVQESGLCGTVCSSSNETVCLSDLNCQWLDTELSGSFCSMKLLFPAEDCPGLEEISCGLAQTSDFTLQINSTQDACFWTGSACEAVDMITLAEEGAQASCHPSDTLLHVEYQGDVAIQDITIGDRVRSSVGYEPVIAIIHGDASVKGVYYNIEGINGESLDISKGHQMYANNQLVDPSVVQVGDKVHSIDGHDVVVSKVSVKTMDGAYHIYTSSGTYYANGVLVSDKHGLKSWSTSQSVLFSLWKKFTEFRYVIGAPIVNDNKMVWFGSVMRSIDSLPLLFKLPVGSVVAPVAFVYGNIVTIEYSALAAVSATLSTVLLMTNRQYRTKKL